MYSTIHKWILDAFTNILRKKSHQDVSVFPLLHKNNTLLTVLMHPMNTFGCTCPFSSDCWSSLLSLRSRWFLTALFQMYGQKPFSTRLWCISPTFIYLFESQLRHPMLIFIFASCQKRMQTETKIKSYPMISSSLIIKPFRRVSVDIMAAHGCVMLLEHVLEITYI